MKSLLVFFCILIRWLFYNFLFLVILKNLTAQVFRSNTVFWNRASGLGDVIWRNSYRTPDAGHRTITIPHFEHLVLSSRGGGEGVYIWYSMDVRAEWPPFSALPSIWYWPLLSTRSIWLAPLFWISIWKAPTFLCIPVHAHIFRSDILHLFSWYLMNWLLYLSNYQQ